MKVNMAWSPTVVNTDVQFEHAIRAVLRKLRSFKRAPDNEESLFELWSELLRAKLLYNNVWVEHGNNYKGGIERFYKAVEELDSLLPRGKKTSDAVRGIRRQLKEIQKAHDAYNNAVDT